MEFIFIYVWTEMSEGWRRQNQKEKNIADVQKSYVFQESHETFMKNLKSSRNQTMIRYLSESIIYLS